MTLKSSIIYLVSNVIEKSIVLFLIPIYTKYLTTSEYGTLSIATSVIAILMIFFTLSLSSSASRYHFEGNVLYRRLHYGNIYFLITIFSVLFSIVLFIITPLIPKSLDIEKHYFSIALIAYLTGFFQIYLQKMQMEYKPITYGIHSILKTALVSFLSIYFLSVLNLGLEGVFLAMLLGLILINLYQIYLLYKEKIRMNFNKKLTKKNLIYSIYLVPHNLATIAMQFIDKYFIAILLGTAQVGIYALGSQLTLFLTVLNTSINKSLVAKTLESFQNRDYTYIASVANIVILVTISAALLLSLFAPEIISLIAPVQYYDAWTIIPSLSFYFVVQMYYYRTCGVLFYIEKATKYVTFTTVFSLAINIILNYIFIQAMGMFGAALATFISIIVVNYLVIYISNKYIKINFTHAKIHAYIIFSYILANINFFVKINLLFKILLFLLFLLLAFYFERKNYLIKNEIKRIGVLS